MTRRDFFSLTSVVAVLPAVSRAPLAVPVHLVLDGRAKLRPQQVSGFWSDIWPEAVRNLGSGGIRLQCTMGPGEVQRPPFREPVISGLQAGALNVVVTGGIPMSWDDGRGLSGVTTLYRGYSVCMIALYRAHGNQIPFLSLNTCLHELLHALLNDIFESRPKGLPGAEREFRVDSYATRLWLFHDGSAVRKAALEYVTRLRESSQASVRGLPH